MTTVLEKHIVPPRGVTIKMDLDPSPEFPRGENRRTTIVTFNDRYELSDLPGVTTPEEFEMHIWKTHYPHLFRNLETDPQLPEQIPPDVRHTLNTLGFPGIIQPVHLCFHDYFQKVRLSTKPLRQNPWDNGQTGWIYMKLSTIHKFELTDEQVLSIMDDELDHMERTINRDVYCVYIEDLANPARKSNSMITGICPPRDQDGIPYEQIDQAIAKLQLTEKEKATLVTTDWSLHEAEVFHLNQTA